MSKQRYCIQCRDKVTGNIGSFGFDPTQQLAHYAVTPVFGSLQGLFAWYRENGFTTELGSVDAEFGRAQSE